MDYNRRDFLRMSAAGLPLVAGGVFFTSTVLGMERGERGAYNENKAEIIHRNSMEKAIREDGKNPEEVKQQVRSRMLELRGKAGDKVSF
jgi:hypothetical protein